MAEQRKVLLLLPDELLVEADRIASVENMNRSEFIRNAMKLYIDQRHKIEIQQSMKKGYEAMSHINKEWAEASVASEYAMLNAYEAILSESD